MSDFTRTEMQIILSALAMLSNRQEEIASSKSLSDEIKERHKQAAFNTRTLACKVDELIPSLPREYFNTEN